MKKLLSIFFIFTITTLPAMAVKCTGLSDILAQYCDDEGYIYTNSKEKAYGTYFTTKNSVKFGCYKYKNNDMTALKKKVANACGIPESKVTIQNDLRRDSGQINKSTKEPAVPSGVICGMDRDSGRLKEEYIDGKCYPTECLTPRWELSGTGTHAKCVEQRCNIKNGTGEWTADGDTWKCSVKSCNKNYKENTEKNKCTKPGEPDTDGGDDQTQQNEPRLSEADSLAKIDELRDNADAMKANEQSTANKLLGATGMGSTGIGGMQMASAMAEENADADAEAAMRAYLATFHCNYGVGKNIPGGERDIELPGGNELIGLYSEYVNLANDLKIRKTALDMRPGIESEPILDAATSGLYDDVAIGKTSGAYTSLARALMDPNGADAAAWAAQKAETADKKKTGMITAGIGAGGSLVGNLTINSGKEKQEKSAEIIAKYEKLKQVFQTAQTEFDALPAKQCSEFTGTTNQGTVPNCECLDKTNSRFSLENGGCVKCENDKIYNENNECVCPSDKPRLEDGQCKAQIPNCQLTGLVTPNECKCVDNATAEKNVCKCKTGYNQQGNECAKQDTTPVAQTIQEEIPEQINLEITSDTLFVSGKAELSQPEGENTLNEFIKDIETYDLNDGNFCIAITGHTDRVPFKKAANKNNQQLSLERANAIKNILISQANINAENIKTAGNGETECTPNKYPNANDSKCRRVDITLTTGTCQS